MDASPPEPIRPIRADAARRASVAWQARVAGGTWDQAAELAGFSDKTTAVHAVRNAYGELPKVDRDELRRLWRDRLELAWSQALRDMKDRRSGAVTHGVRVASLAIHLDGLAEPTRVDISVSSTFEALTRELEANNL